MPRSLKILIALLFAVISVTCCYFVFSGGANFWSRQFGNANEDLLKNETTYYASQGYRIGQFLKNNNPDRKILLLSEPDFMQNESIKQLAYAMIEGYGSNNVTLDTIAVPPGYGDMQIPLYMSMKAEDFDRVLDRYPDTDFVISMVGLPPDLENLNALRNENSPKLLLLGLPSGPLPQLSELIRDGQIVAVVISNPAARYDVPAPKDRNAAFDLRYVLVSKENLEEYRRQVDN